MKKYITAVDARAITNEAIQFSNQPKILIDVLEDIAEAAGDERSERILEGVGAAIDLPRLMAALVGLGYAVQDISGTQTSSGSRYLDRSIKICW